MMKRPQIIAPAGNLRKLKLAVEYGADAVYAGVSEFSLRSRSTRNFTYETFKEGIDYAHSKGVKLYATLNAFHLNGQIEGLKKSILKLKELKPDAFIVASAGAMTLAKELAPEIPLHVSTQANVLNYLDAKVYESMGAKRIVVARETSLKDAKIIKEHCPNVELEAFVHGSMCFAYSGRCLLSAVQSGRQSNRGACANDCRFPYDVYVQSKEDGALLKVSEDENGSYIFNSKDLNLATYVKQIMEQDCIDAFKIEGRTKSEYYVALAVRTYKMAIEDALNGVFNPSLYEEELNTLKNRGFTDGYLVKRPLDKTDTQNHEATQLEGTHQVHGFSEDGKTCVSKGVILPNTAYEIFAPLNAKIDESENEIGKIYKKDNKFYLEFKKLITPNNKLYESLHSGNENAILLPTTLPQLSFLRAKI